MQNSKCTSNVWCAYHVIYIITFTWAYTIMKNRQNMCITKRKGEHTCFACEESASNWASNHTHTIQIEGGQNYTK